MGKFKIILLVILVVLTVFLMVYLNKKAKKTEQTRKEIQALGSSAEDFANKFRPLWEKAWEKSMYNYYNDKTSEGYKLALDYLNSNNNVIRNKEGGVTDFKEGWEELKSRLIADGVKDIKNPIKVYDTHYPEINKILDSLGTVYSNPETQKALKLV